MDSRKLWAGIATATLFFTIAVVIHQIDSGQDLRIMRLVAGVPHADKLLHFTLYGLLAMGLDASLGQRDVCLRGRLMPLAVCIVAGLGSLEEISQLWFPQRTPDLVDWLLTCLGAALLPHVARRWLRTSPGRAHP